jgi:hypothetical protein
VFKSTRQLQRKTKMKIETLELISVEQAILEMTKMQLETINAEIYSAIISKNKKELKKLRAERAKLEQSL